MSRHLPKPDAVYSCPAGSWEAYWGDLRAVVWPDLVVAPSGAIWEVWRWHSHRCAKNGARGVADNKTDAMKAARQAMANLLKGEA